MTPLYSERYPVGTTVRVTEREHLDAFMRSWTLHHPLEKQQLDCAGAIAKVAGVAFYHGGDVLYELVGLPGIWHERLLLSVPRTS